MARCATLTPSPLPLILSYKSEKSLCGAGNFANCARIVPVYASRFAFNDLIRDAIIEEGQDRTRLRPEQALFSGVLAGLAQQSLCYPFETIRTRLSLGVRSLERSPAAYAFRARGARRVASHLLDWGSNGNVCARVLSRPDPDRAKPPG